MPNTPGGDHERYRRCRAYLERESRIAKRTIVVGDGLAGQRWFHGPFCFERYTGDDEPRPDPDGPRRLVIWQRMGEAGKAAGWWPGFLRMRIGLTGCASLERGDGYAEAWSPHAQRHRKRWLAEEDWRIDETPLEDFLAAYRGASQDPVLKFMFAKIVRDKVACHGSRVRLFGATRGADTEAGFACVDVPETGESIHLMSFIRDQARSTSVGVGLIDHWFRHGLKEGYRDLAFGLFWSPGEPRSWKGFSRFKSQFGVRFLSYPRPLVRLVGK